MKILGRRIRYTIATGIISALLLGCGSDAPTDTSSKITIEGSSFSVTGDVKSSDAASVTNRDSFKHTVTADEGAFDIEVNGGATESLPTLNPGTYSFHCMIHPSMQGTLKVV